MKPYPKAGLNELQRMYNYRHSRARRISENMFGIIANRWRVFRSIIFLPPKTIETITLGTLVLHNFLRQSASKHIYSPPSLVDTNSRTGDLIPGQWRNEPPTQSFFPQCSSQYGNNITRTAKETRDTLTDYFCNEGAVPWQWIQS